MVMTKTITCVASHALSMEVIIHHLVGEIGVFPHLVMDAKVSAEQTSYCSSSVRQ